MEIFTKSNGIKLFAVLLVLAFLFETFAITQGSANILAEENGNEETQTPNLYFGVALTNATISSYGDVLGYSISAEGNPEKLEAEALRLKAEGLVSYTSKTQKGLVFNIPKGANLSGVVGRLAALNATLSARAEASLKDPLTFYTDNGTKSISVKSLRIEVDPTIPVGYQVGLRIKATITDERILEWLYEVTPFKKDIFVVGEVAELYPQHSAIGVLEWPDRRVDKNATVAYLSQKFSNVSILAITNNSVGFNKPVSLGTLGSIFAANLSYVQGVTANSLRINETFTDNVALENDLGPFLAAENISVVYPLSYVRIDFSTENYSREFLNSSMNAAGFFVYRLETIRIGSLIRDDEGREYAVLNRDYADLLPYTNETGVTELVLIRANVLGNKVLNYTIPEE